MKFSLPYIFLLFMLAYFPFLVMKSTQKNRVYISYILYLLPFMIFDLMPKEQVVTVFDILSYMYLGFFLMYNKPGKNSVYSLIAYLLFLFLLMGSFNSEFIFPALMSLFRFMSIFIFAKVLLTELNNDFGYIETVFKHLKVILFIAIFFMVLQMIFGLKISVEANFISPYYMNPNIDTMEGIRYPSYFQDPQKCAQFIAAISFLFLLRTADDPKKTWINLGLFLVAVIAMFYTGGRAALFGLCVGLFFIFLFFPLRYKLLFTIPIVIVITLVSMFKENFIMFNRASNTASSFDERYEFWTDAVRTLEKHPLLGIGIGNYQLYTEKHNPGDYWFSQGEITFYDQPESGYLKYLIEFGLFAGIAFFSFLLIPMIRGAWTFLTVRKDFRLIILSAALISWMIGFITVASLTDMRIFILIVTLICLLISCTNQVVQEKYMKDVEDAGA